MKISSFKDLVAWREAHKLAIMIYRETGSFPNSEQFGLVNQLRRASVSISSNIAEGFSRQSPKEKINFYYISLGSLTEVQNQILLAKDLGFIENKAFEVVDAQTISVSRLCNGLIKSSKKLVSWPPLIPNTLYLIPPKCILKFHNLLR
ncbi:MAG: four helix bundle protein [Patescibacteria group bacterium]